MSPIEGVAFDLDVVLPEELVAAIRADAYGIDAQRLLFQTDQLQRRPKCRRAAIRQVHPPASATDRPPAVFVDMCHFDGGQTAIFATGPIDLALRNCTIGPGQPSIWFDNPRSNSPVPAELRLSHSSVMTGTDPVFRFDGSHVRVWLDDCAVAPAGRSPATLVAVDNPRNLRLARPIATSTPGSESFKRPPVEVTARSRSSTSRVDRNPDGSS